VEKKTTLKNIIINLIEDLRPKYIGITIADKQLTAIELTKGIFFTEDVADPSDTTPAASIWQNPASLKALVKKIFKIAGIIIWSYRPVVVFSIPPNTTKPDNKMIYDAVMNAGAKSVYLLDDLFLAALGTGVYQKNEGPLYHKKIYLLVQKEASYLGIILAGGTFEVKTIPKGHDNLTKDDLQLELRKLLDNFPKEFPAQFQHRAISKEVKQELEKAWQRKMEQQVYITAPERFKDHWGQMIDDYWLVYTNDGELAVSKGIEQFLPTLVAKRYPVGPKPISPVKIYILLILLIVIVTLFILKR
jgi:hypothetical protein